jgi:hypothetical protein
MRDQKHKLLLALAVVALAVVAVLIVRFLPETCGRACPSTQAACKPAVAVSPAAQKAPVFATPAEHIAALEKQITDLNQAYADVMRKSFELRRQWQDNNKDALAREMTEAQRAVEAALERHPTIVALRQEMAKVRKEEHAASLRQAELLTIMHAQTKERKDTLKKAQEEITLRMDEERRKTILEPSGKKDYSNMTEEEANKLIAIQEKYAKQSRELAAQQAQRQPDENEIKMTDEYKALGAKRIADNARHAQIVNDLPATRASLRVSAPEIVALDKVLTEKNARWLASMNASPAISASMQEARKLDQQRVEARMLLNDLRKQSAAATALPVTVAETNG